MGLRERAHIVHPVKVEFGGSLVCGVTAASTAVLPRAGHEPRDQNRGSGPSLEES